MTTERKQLWIEESRFQSLCGQQSMWWLSGHDRLHQSVHSWLTSSSQRVRKNIHLDISVISRAPCTSLSPFIFVLRFSFIFNDYWGDSWLTDSQIEIVLPQEKKTHTKVELLCSGRYYISVYILYIYIYFNYFVFNFCYCNWQIWLKRIFFPVNDFSSKVTWDIAQLVPMSLIRNSRDYHTDECLELHSPQKEKSQFLHSSLIRLFLVGSDFKCLILKTFVEWNWDLVCVESALNWLTTDRIITKEKKIGHHNKLIKEKRCK